MCFCTPTVRTPFCSNCNQAMFLRINELREENKALRKDAAKYRYIKAHAGSAMDWDWWVLRHEHNGLDAPELLDSAIDAAMGAEE